MSKYAVLFAPDGKHFQKIRKGKIEKLWDYFNFDIDVAEQIVLNPMARFRLVNLETKKVMAEKGRTITEADINENLERAEKGLPLTMPLSVLDGRLKKEYYSKHNEWYEILKKNSKKYKEYVKRKKEYDEKRHGGNKSILRKV